MSLSFREEWQLRGIERRLRESEPDMAAMLEDFAKLDFGEPIGGGPEACSSGGWARRQLGRIAHGWLAYAAASEGWLDPGRAVGL